MPSKKWSGLNHMQLGQFGEYYAKMEFACVGENIPGRGKCRTVPEGKPYIDGKPAGLL